MRNYILFNWIIIIIYLPENGLLHWNTAWNIGSSNEHQFVCTFLLHHFVSSKSIFRLACDETTSFRNVVATGAQLRSTNTHTQINYFIVALLLLLLISARAAGEAVNENGKNGKKHRKAGTRATGSNLCDMYMYKCVVCVYWCICFFLDSWACCYVQ